MVFGFVKKVVKSVFSAIGDAVGFLLDPFIEEPDIATGVLVNKQSNNAAIPVIYGQRKVGGTRVFVSTGGNDNEYLYIALVLCEGEVDSLGDVYINDVLSTDSKYSGLVTIEKYVGTDTQTSSSLLSAATDTWGANHRLRGIAYLALRLKYDADAFSSIPDIQCIVQGRKVYDPRNNTTAYSSNPALCLRDYLTNARYGKGLSSTIIDDTSFSSAANTCDNTITEYQGGGSAKLFECNAVISTDKKIFDNVKILLQGMRGLMPYQDGTYALIIDKATTSTFTLDETNTHCDITVRDSGKNKRFNRVRATFVNPLANWQEDVVIWPPAGSTEESTFATEDNNEVLQKDIKLSTNTNYYSARDIARIVCRASRENPLSMELTATPEALQVAVGDVVTVKHQSLGWTSSSTKDFRVIGMQLADSGDVRFSLQQYSNIYTYQSLAQQPSAPATTLPDPFSVPAPTNLSLTQGVTIEEDGTSVSRLVINWTASASAFVSAYIVELTPSGFDSTQVRISTPDAAGNDVTTLLVPNAYTVQHSVTVRAENDAGVRSAALTGTVTITGDTTAPGVPSSVSATGAYRSIVVAWTNSSDTDFAAVDVYRSNTSNGQYNRVASVSGAYGADGKFVDAGLADGVTRYYKLKAIDRSGNASAFTSIVNGSTDAASTQFGPRNQHGYVYYTSASASSPSTPSATSFNFSNGTFSGLTSGWQLDPLNQTGADGKFWAARFSILEASYGGSQTITFSTPFASFEFNGLVTFTNLNTELADPASTEITTIDGGLVKTGVVNLGNTSGMAVRQGKTGYSSTNTGFWLGNDGGTPKFHIGTSSKFFRFDGTDVEAKGIFIKDTAGNLVFDADEIDGVYIKDLSVATAAIANAAVDTLQIAGNAVTIPEGADGSINISLGTSYTKVGELTLDYGTVNKNPTAAIALGVVQVAGDGSQNQGINAELRRVYGNNAYNGKHNTASIRSDFGGQCITGGKYPINQVASYTNVKFELHVKVNSGTRTAGRFFIVVMSSKR